MLPPDEEFLHVHQRYREREVEKEPLLRLPPRQLRHRLWRCESPWQQFLHGVHTERVERGVEARSVRLSLQPSEVLLRQQLAG